MPNRQDDIRAMVVALFTLFGHFQRAGRRGSAATLALLRLIGEREGIRPSQAAVELGIHQSTVTRQMQSLESDGFIVARTDQRDKRASTLSLTPAGQTEIVRLSDSGFARFTSFLESWSQDDVRALGRLLERLTATLAEARERGD